MNSPVDLKILEAQITQIYRSDPQAAAGAIEDYLLDSFAAESSETKGALLDALVREFQTGSPAEVHSATIDTQSLAELVPLLLGRNIDDLDCTAEELIERLADSLNTVFDTLNELIMGINTTFMGQVSGTETIRLIIRTNVDDSAQSISLQNYLDQIKEAFSIMHEAFKDAAMTKMTEMLTELNPRQIEKSLNGRLKIGPFQKAEMFKIFEEKYRTLDNWLKTGLLTDALLREFEKNCQKIYAKK